MKGQYFKKGFPSSFCNFCLFRLLDQCPSGMEPEATRWGKLLYPMPVHTANKVREKSLAALQIGLPLILKDQDHQDAISQNLVSDLQMVCFS